MDKPQNRNSSLAVFLITAFAAIVALTLIINHRSRVANEISFPLNNGIATLSTFDNLLTAVSNDNKIYVWEWADVSKKPREGAVASGQTSLVTSDTVISVKGTNPDCVIVSGLDANNSRREISLPLGSDTAYLSVNRDRSKIVLLLARSDNDSSGREKYDLLDVSIGAGKAQPIVTIDSEQSKLGHLSVSDDGNRIVAVGEKNGHGWMFVVDAKEKRLEWQKEFPDFKKIFKAAFSINGEVIYARGTDSTLLVIKTSSGDITDRLLPTKENKSTYKIQPVQTVAVSGDGNLVAATIFGSIYLWDTKTNKILYQTQTGHKVLSSINFSVDSRFLATSDMRQGGKIIIFKTPQTNK
jgi:WD40 repeat protein